jgi:hypothetical protein
MGNVLYFIRGECTFMSRVTTDTSVRLCHELDTSVRLRHGWRQTFMYIYVTSDNRHSCTHLCICDYVNLHLFHHNQRHQIH